MSNYLAVATVTATLAQLLEQAAKEAVTGATATPGRPKDTTKGQSSAEVNVYLYQVIPNAAQRNADLPTRRPDGTVVQRPQAALDLHYLLTFYGKQSEMEPQRLLASAVGVLHSRPILTREMVRATIQAAVDADPDHYLAESDLADQVETVKFVPLPLNLEELSKLWSVFFQVPYALSVAYKASVVLIEADGMPQRSLPVRAPLMYDVLLRQPVIERVMSQAGADQHIIAGSTLVIEGRRLRGEITKVRIGELEVTPASVSDTRVCLALSTPTFPPGSLRAGGRVVQVAHPVMMGIPPTPHRGVESNAAAFVLSPIITKDSGGDYEIAIANLQTAADGTRSADLSVKVNPEAGESQRVELLLNEAALPSDRRPYAYIFKAPPLDADSDTIEFAISGVEAGDYLVRVQVDGAESPLDVDADGRYSGPTATIP